MEACPANEGHPRQMQLYPDEGSSLRKREALLDLLKDGDWSVSGAARHLAIDPTTAMAWAAANNITTPRRPKLLKPPRLKKLIALLVTGTDIEKAAKAVEISPVSVIKVLRTGVGLHDIWRQARRDQARAKNRGLWAQVVTANPMLGVKAVRITEPAAYAWLYRNDRSWLNDQIANLPHCLPSNNSNTSWDLRDLEIADSIRLATLELTVEQPGRVIALWQIYQRLPELKGKLAKLDRLPLSKQALDAATRRPDRTIQTARMSDGV